MWDFCYKRPGLGILKQKGGKIREVGDLYLDVFCCLQVNGPVTGRTYNWGERGLIPGEGTYGQMYRFDVVLQVNGLVTGGTYSWGEGGLITGWIVLFTGKWACNSVGALFSWGGGGKGHKRKFFHIYNQRYLQFHSLTQ